MTQPPSAKKRIRRRDLFPLQNKLDRIADEMQHLNSELWQRRMDAEDRRDMARDNEPAMTPPLHELLERTATLLQGVIAGLERLGGTTLPAYRDDILALRDQIGELRREMSGYRATLMRISRWLDDVSPPKPEDAAAPSWNPNPYAAYQAGGQARVGEPRRRRKKRGADQPLPAETPQKDIAQAPQATEGHNQDKLPEEGST